MQEESKSIDRDKDRMDAVEELRNSLDQPALDLHEPDDTIITAVEFLESQSELEKQAIEALPGDPSFCTFSKGYLNQPVYTCLTCYQTNKERPPVADSDGQSFVGLCYGCYVSCHTEHDVVELYNRRHFRCDCGTSNNQGKDQESESNSWTYMKCKIDTTKKQFITNDDNDYSRNFDGLFCKCKKLYNAEQENSVMIECIICQDWYHEPCIGVKFPPEGSFEDFICSDCIQKDPFLDRFKCVVNEQSLSSDSTKIVSSICVSHLDDDQPRSLAAIFTRNSWKTSICKCQECGSLLKSRRLEFLIHEEPAYEPPPDPEAGLSSMDLAMSKLHHAKHEDTINGIRAYQSLKDDLLVYLKQFAANNQVVTEQDIQSFFMEKQASRKRRRGR